MQVPGAVEAEDDVPGLADMAGPEQAGSQEPREPAGAARELRAPVLELDLPAGGDPPGDSDRDRFAAARRVARGRSAQPTSASQSRFSRLSRMCMRNIDAVEPSKARWS